MVTWLPGLITLLNIVSLYTIQVNEAAAADNNGSTRESNEPLKQV